MNRTLCSAIVGSLSLFPATTLLADRAPTSAPATAPSTQPAADVKALVRQLGDDDFRVRMRAQRELRAMGKDARPALEAARATADAEVRSRIEEILDDKPEVAADNSPVPQPAPPGAVNSYSTSVSINNGTRTTHISEPGRTIDIEEQPGRIHMKVEGQLDGKPATREYDAKNPDDLKKKHPAAFALYQQKTGQEIRFNFGGGGGAAGQANVQMKIQVNGNANINVVPQAAAAGPADEFAKVNELQEYLLTKMRDVKTPGKSRGEVQGLIQKLRRAIPNNPDKPAEAQKAYELAGDALRTKVAELDLGDVEKWLPPKPKKEDKKDEKKP